MNEKDALYFILIIYFTQEPELELLAQAQVSLTSHINIFFIFFLCVCEFNVYSRNSFELKLFFSKIIEFFPHIFVFIYNVIKTSVLMALLISRGNLD